jgi:REP element-mobilizing transposase RayT
MPRKLRIEYPGATYHIISRGNYRKDLFVPRGSGQAFERCIFEVVKRCGWELYAYVIMSNHYHLALRTPEPNLVVGMKWLQSTFATRFNRFIGERGHVFQGRYKSLLITEDRPVLGLIDYIHLNPVRAGLCTIDSLKSHSLSSYPKYWKRQPPDGLRRDVLASLCGFADSSSGMRTYRKHLELCEEADPSQRDELLKKYCRGWFSGSAHAKAQLAKDINESTPSVDWETADLKDLNEARWEAIVANEMKDSKISESDLKRERKAAPWKVAIAKKLRRETTAPNPWIARRLQMGSPNYVSNLIHS